jgi:hypothetical protein
MPILGELDAAQSVVRFSRPSLRGAPRGSARACPGQTPDDRAGRAVASEATRPSRGRRTRTPSRAVAMSSARCSRIGSVDRPVLSGGSTLLLWRTGAGRIVGSVTAASGTTRRSPELLKEKMMEEVEQSMRATIKEKREVAKGTLLVVFDLLGEQFEYRPGQFFWVELLDPPYEDEKGPRRHISAVTSPTERGHRSLHPHSRHRLQTLAR